MDKQTLTILDCTLRDGGYYNSWDFPLDMIQDYLEAMVAARIDVVEIGFRFIDNTGFKGPCAYSTDNFIRGLDVPDELSIGVMINASDIAHATDSIKTLQTLFPEDAQASPVKLVRIASHIHEFSAACKASAWLSARGFMVGVNLMQVSDRSAHEIMQLSEEASKWPIDVLYFADSMGSMLPSKTAEIVGWIRKKWGGAIGIHTHDSMGLALQNTLRSVEEGATWLDSTVTGMGRGPGNACTEELVIEIGQRRSDRADMVPIMALIRNHLGPLKKQHGWGKNPYYYLAGKFGLHPTYIQEMLNDSRYTEEDILSVIEHLRLKGAKSYSRTRLDSARHFFQGESKGQWKPAEVLAGREVLLLGSGPGALRHQDALESYIRLQNPIVLALNTQVTVAEELVDFRLASHPVRLVADYRLHASLKQPLITPASILPDEIRDSLAGNELLDYGMTVEQGRFEAEQSYCVIPTSLVVAYSLAVALSGKASRILMAGFDGYESGDPRNEEMRSLLELYLSTDDHPPVVSITPTVFNILECHSVYGMIR